MENNWLRSSPLPSGARLQRVPTSLLTKIKRLQRGLLRQTTITAQPLRCKTLYYPARNFYSCYLHNLFHEKRFLTQQDYNVCSLHVVPFFLNCLI